MPTKISPDLNMTPLKMRPESMGLFNILSCFFAKRQREFVIWPFFNTCTNN